MAVNEELKIVIRAEARGAINELKQVQGASAKVTTNFKSIAKSLIGPLGVTAGVIALTRGVKAFVSQGIKFAGQLEKLDVGFTTLLGSASAANDLMEELETFSSSTPFQLDSLASGAQRLIAFGTDAKEVVDVMRDLGNAAMGDQAILDRLTLAYGKLQAKGRASLEELNMFTEAGVPILKALQDQLGLTKEELFDYVTKGKIGFEDVNKALQDLTQGEGQFAGMIEKQSQTLIGLQSTLKDNMQLLSADIMTIFVPAMKASVTWLTNLVRGFRGAGIALDSTAETWDELFKERMGGATGVTGFIPGSGPSFADLGALTGEDSQIADRAKEFADGLRSAFFPMTKDQELDQAIDTLQKFINTLDAAGKDVSALGSLRNALRDLLEEMNAPAMQAFGGFASPLAWMIGNNQFMTPGANIGTQAQINPLGLLPGMTGQDMGLFGGGSIKGGQKGGGDLKEPVNNVKELYATMQQMGGDKGVSTAVSLFGEFGKALATGADAGQFLAQSVGKILGMISEIFLWGALRAFQDPKIPAEVGIGFLIAAGVTGLFGGLAGGAASTMGKAPSSSSVRRSASASGTVYGVGDNIQNPVIIQNIAGSVLVQDQLDANAASASRMLTSGR